MIEQLSHEALAELHRAVHLSSAPPRRPSYPDLTELRRLIQEGGTETALGFPTLPRKTYEACRGQGAPTAARLVRYFGDWLTACQVAAGAPEEDSIRLHKRRRGSYSRPYVRREVIASLQLCADELQRRPSSTDYTAWAFVRRAHARASGQDPRYPSLAVIYRLFPAPAGGWTAALEAASPTRRTT